MPHYHLHIERRGALVKDLEGGDYADLAAAKSTAIAAAREIMSERLLAGFPLGDDRFSIVDTDGQELASLLFKEAIPTGA